VSTLEELLRGSDVVSLHCPATSETRHLINEQTLSLMPEHAYLINTARGDVVHEAALTSALKERKIAGAGLDVLSVEPPAPSNPLLSAPRCVITPHIAWATRDARRRLLATTADNVAACLAGSPRHVVNG
jgi:glycerate dehydrogenase